MGSVTNTEPPHSHIPNIAGGAQVDNGRRHGIRVIPVVCPVPRVHAHGTVNPYARVTIGELADVVAILDIEITGADVVPIGNYSLKRVPETRVAVVITYFIPCGDQAPPHCILVIVNCVIGTRRRSSKIDIHPPGRDHGKCRNRGDGSRRRIPLHQIGVEGEISVVVYPYLIEPVARPVLQAAREQGSQVDGACENIIGVVEFSYAVPDSSAEAVQQGGLSRSTARRQPHCHKSHQSKSEPPGIPSRTAFIATPHSRCKEVHFLLLVFKKACC